MSATCCIDITNCSQDCGGRLDGTIATMRNLTNTSVTIIVVFMNPFPRARSVLWAILTERDMRPHGFHWSIRIPLEAAWPCTRRKSLVVCNRIV